MGAGSDCYNEYTAFHLFEEYLEVYCVCNYFVFASFSTARVRRCHSLVEIRVSSEAMGIYD